VQVGGREDDEATMPKVHPDQLGPLQKKILQAITEVHHQGVGRICLTGDP